MPEEDSEKWAIIDTDLLFYKSNKSSDCDLDYTIYLNV